MALGSVFNKWQLQGDGLFAGGGFVDIVSELTGSLLAGQANARGPSQLH